MGVFEFKRVKSLIEKYIPCSPCKVIDVGGGTGKYAAWLAKQGHEVHLVEPVAKHLQIAKERASKLKTRFQVHSGESRNLAFPSNSADLVILHGPLYHLQEEKDRIKTIQEAKRVVKHQGIILAFAINYTASTVAGLVNGIIHKRPFLNMCKAELSTGIHNPPDDFPWLLAEAFYHNPGQLKAEFVNQDLTFLNTYAVEGMVWLDKDFFASTLHEQRNENLLELLALTENDPQLLAFSPHMMIATQKPERHGS